MFSISTKIVSNQLNKAKCFAQPEPGPIRSLLQTVSPFNATKRMAAQTKGYLLVPTHLIAKVQPELHQYLHNIQQGQLYKQFNDIPISNQVRPHEIYVLTVAVQRNLEFLKSVASIEVWKNAPSTIRQSTGSKVMPLLSRSTTPTCLPAKSPNVNKSTSNSTIRKYIVQSIQSYYIPSRSPIRISYTNSSRQQHNHDMSIHITNTEFNFRNQVYRDQSSK